MGDSLPYMPMNRRIKFDAASFVLGGEIRNRTKTQTNKQQPIYPHLAYEHVRIITYGRPRYSVCSNSPHLNIAAMQPKNLFAQTINMHAIVDSNIVRCRHLAKWTKHDVVFVSGPLPPLRKNMSSSTKPEVHNVLHCRQRRTKPRQHCHS